MKTVKYFFVLFFSIFWVYMVISIHSEQHIEKIFISYFITPLYIFLAYYVTVNLLKGRLLIILLFHVLATIIVLLLFILSPVLKIGKDDQVFEQQKRYDIVQKIYNAYIFAYKNKEYNEADFYANIIKISFPERENFLIKGSTSISRDRENIKYMRSLQNTIIDSIVNLDKLTIPNFYNLDASEILEAINDLITIEKYYSAQYLLFRYITIFGLNNETEILHARIQKYIGKFFNAKRTSLIDLELHLIYWRDVLYSLDSGELDILAGYRTLIALQNTNPSNSNIQWLLDEYKKKISTFTFFAKEARKSFIIDVAKSKQSKPIRFIIENDEGKFIVLAQNVSISLKLEAVYFNDIELIQLDKQSKLQWHIRTPYAKISNNKLYIHAIEENSIVTYQPEIVYGDYSNTWFMSTPILIDHIAAITINPFEAGLLTLVHILPIWEKYNVSMGDLYMNILTTLFFVVIFIFGGYSAMIFAYSMLIKNQKYKDWSKKTNFIGLIYISMATIPFSLFMTSLISYFSQVMTAEIFRIFAYVLIVLFMLILSFFICILQIQSTKYIINEKAKR